MTKAKSVYLLLGPEIGEKNDFIKGIREILISSGDYPPDEYTFYPYDTEVSEIISILRNIPLFAPSKIVTIKNCHDLKKKDISLITDYLQSPASDSVLFLLSEKTKADAALEKAVPADARKIFWEMFDSRKKGWVIQYFHKQNITVDSSAVDFLIDMIEGDSESLKKECSNLVLFFDAGEVITEEKIADFFYSRKEENIFSLFNHIAVKDFEKSVETASNIFLSGENNPVQALGGLLWQVRNLYEVKKLACRKKSLIDAFKELKINIKKIQGIYTAAAENYTIEEIENIIYLTASYDFLFRSSRMEMQQIMFPVFLYSVITGQGKTIIPRSGL